MKERQPEWYSYLKNDPLPTRTFNNKSIENIEQRSMQTINKRTEKGRSRLQWIAYLGVIFAVLILAVTFYKGAIPAGINQSTNTPKTQTQSPSSIPNPTTQVFKLKGEVGAVEQPSFMYGVMSPKFVADPNTEYRIIGREGSFVQIVPNASHDQPLTGWIPEWYLSSDGSTKIEKVDPYELIVAESVPYSMYPEESVPSGFPLDIGKVVQVTGRYDKWLRVNIITYDSPNVGDKWVPESAFEKWDPDKALEGFLKVNAKVYDESGTEMDAPNYLNPIRVKARQGDKYLITSAGGYSGVIAKQDFVPNPFNLNLFIHSVQPSEGSSSNETNIKIYFSREMNQTTLNSKTIQISEAKHSSDLTDLFQFNYDPQNRILSLLPKNNDFNFGTENTVTIKISGTIQDQSGKVMGSAYSWSFKTSK